MNPEEQQQVVGPEVGIPREVKEGEIDIIKKSIAKEDFDKLKHKLIEKLGDNIYEIFETILKDVRFNESTRKYELDNNTFNRLLENLENQKEDLEEAIKILTQGTTIYDPKKWYDFTNAYYDLYLKDDETYVNFMTRTKLEDATDVQKIELYTYYELDPSILNKLSLKLFENADDIEIIKISEGGREITDKLSINIPDGYKKRGPFIVLNSEATNYDNRLLSWEDVLVKKVENIEDIYVIMLGDGGVISGKGKDAIWDNVSDNQNKYSLRFRYAGWTDTNRLLQNSNKILDVFQQSNKNFGKEFVYTMTHGGKTRKRSKRKSKSKTQRKSKSKSKTQRRRKSTLKKGGAKSKRRYRK
jgi:RNAse (barnase) inhibitor barstar